MKTLKLLNSCLLVLAALLLVTAVFAFVNGDIIYGICNIIWMWAEIFFFLVNKESIEIKSINFVYGGFLSAVDDTIEEYGSAIITKNEDGTWRLTAGGRNNTSCASENNDNKEFVHNEKGVKK
jgi:hypothetical protein